MSVYPLQSVLELKQRAEDAAAERLADATRGRAEAEQEDARLLAIADTARGRLDEARRTLDREGHQNHIRERPVAGISLPAATTAAVASAAWTATAASFVERRRHELTQARAARAKFRRGPLTEARAAESAARRDHLAAQCAREAFEKHAANHRAAELKTIERREDETLEDVARVARHARVSKTHT
jgi:hypothetical protein